MEPRIKFGNSKIILPEHIGIIMDGNGRWANKKKLHRSFGHTAGANNFRKIARYCNDIGIKYLTIFAFSTENWKRPEDEVSHLMKLFEQYLREGLKDFKNENVKLVFLGSKKEFSSDLRNLIDEIELASSMRDGMVLNIAMNYGGRSEIINAVRKIALEVNEGKLSFDDINEQTFAARLYTASCPDPDLIIRTGNEYRISNFLLWQSAYAEYAFVDEMWPDFKPRNLHKVLLEFSSRKRRFGGIIVDR